MRASLIFAVSAMMFIMAVTANPAKAVLWSDPAGNAMGWYNLSSDFTVQGLAASDADDMEFFDYYNVNTPGKSCLKTFDNGDESAGATMFMTKGGFTEGFYTLRFTGLGQTADTQNFTISVRQPDNSWTNFSQISYIDAGTWQANTSTKNKDGGSNGLGIPAFVNDTGYLDIIVWSNFTKASGTYTCIGAINVTNYTAAHVYYTFIISPTNSTYYTNSITANISNSTIIHSFWFVINSTNYTYFSPYTTPNGTYAYPLNGFFNLTVYGNSSDGLTTYTRSEYFTIRSYQMVSNTWPAKTVETRRDPYDISILDSTGISTVVAKLFLNGTYVTSPTTTPINNYWNFSANVIPPYLQGGINQTNITGVWQVTVNGTLVDSVITNYTFSYFVERIRLLKCASPMLNLTATFTALYEQNPSVKINVTDFDMSTVAVYIDSGAREYAFELGGDYQFEFCLFPGHVGSYKMNATVKYSNATYDDRWYWTEGKAMKNTTTNITLLMYDAAFSKTPVFSVLNLFQAPQSGVIVEAWRWFVGTNSYNMTATGKTSNEGIVELLLKPDEQYIYKIYRGGVLLVSWGPDLLTAATTSKELYTESGSFSDLWDYYNKITSTCTNTTSMLACSFSDSSGIAAMTSLWVTAFIDPLNNTKTLCITNSTESSGTLVCSFAGYENKTIQYTLYVTLVDGTKTIIANNFLITSAPLLSQGIMGVFAAFIIILSMSLIGLSMPQSGISGSLVMGYIGVAVSWWFGLLVVPLGAVVGLGFAIAVIVYILTTRGYGQ